ncbi:MAG: hypothetical protein ACREJQ_04830 [bacterium]
MNEQAPEARAKLIMRISFLVAIGIYFFTVWYLRHLGSHVEVAPSTLQVLTYIFIGLSVAQVALSSMWSVARLFIIKLALFEVIAIYGLLLGFLGLPLYFAGCFMMVAGAGIATAQGVMKQRNNPGDSE